jgi:hypothetical protein
MVNSSILKEEEAMNMELRVIGVKKKMLLWKTLLRRMEVRIGRK